MKGREGRRGGGQREGGQGRVHCLLHKARSRPRTFFFILKCAFQGFISDSNLDNSRQILPKLIGASSISQSSRSGPMTAEGRGRTKNDLQKSAICHCDP